MVGEGRGFQQVQGAACDATARGTYAKSKSIDSDKSHWVVHPMQAYILAGKRQKSKKNHLHNACSLRCLQNPPVHAQIFINGLPKRINLLLQYILKVRRLFRSRKDNSTLR